MNRSQLIQVINDTCTLYYGYPMTVSGLGSKNKQQLELTLAYWAKRVDNRDTYLRIMSELNLTDNQRLAYSMGYKDALTEAQGSEYDRAMEYYRLSMGFKED